MHVNNWIVGTVLQWLVSFGVFIAFTDIVAYVKLHPQMVKAKVGSRPNHDDDASLNGIALELPKVQ